MVVYHLPKTSGKFLFHFGKFSLGMTVYHLLRASFVPSTFRPRSCKTAVAEALQLLLFDDILDEDFSITENEDDIFIFSAICTVQLCVEIFSAMNIFLSVNHSVLLARRVHVPFPNVLDDDRKSLIIIHECS